MMMDLAKGKLITDEDFMKIKCPVLFAIGDRDKTASLNDTIDIYSKVSNSQLLVLPNSPHDFNQLNIDILKQFITGFFDN
jgi:pimeloyl-ACP methyl ester carboxylesterase